MAALIWAPFLGGPGPGPLALVLAGAVAMARRRYPKPEREGFGDCLERLDHRRVAFGVSAGAGVAAETALFFAPAHDAAPRALPVLIVLAALGALVFVGLKVSPPAVRAKNALIFKRDGERQIDAATKKRVFARDQGRCVYCHKKVVWRGQGDDALQFDHVVAHSRGGPSTEENVAVACKRHNLAKGSDYGPRARLVARELCRYYAARAGAPTAAVPEVPGPRSAALPPRPSLIDLS